MARLLSVVGCRGTSFPVCALDSTVLLALRQSWLPLLRVGSVNGVCIKQYGASSSSRGKKSHHKYFPCNQLHQISLLSTDARQQQLRRGSAADTSIHLSEDKTQTSNATLKKLKPTEYNRLFSLAAPEKWTLAGAISLLAISSTITMAVPFALGHVIDIIYTADPTAMKQNLDRVCLALSGIFLLGASANFGRVYLMNVAGQRITRSLRSLVFASVMKQEIGFFDTNKTGELINRLSADTSLVSQSVTMNISDGLRSVVMAMAGVGMMFYMSTKLAVVGLSIVPPVALLAIGYGRYVRNITKSVQDTLAQATQVAEERIANVRTVRSFAQELKEIQTYDSKIDHVLKLTYKESLAKGIFFGMTGLSGNIIILSVLYYGGGLVAESALSVGQLSSFLLYAAYVGIALGGISTFYSEMNRGIGASTRLFALMDRQPTIPTQGGLTLPVEDMKGEIRFSNVNFAYPSRPDVTLFKSLDFIVPAGSVVAVVGASGSGKSTIGSLLLRLYDPVAGEITVDGVPITRLDPAWLRTLIGSVSQEPTLFSTSIRENLLYGAQDPSSITEDQLVSAAQEANALSFIQSFPEGFDTLVGERGVMLSGGQKQRIAIARALISDPRILLLDEATSALDAESESLVQEALERLMKGRTVITIAHRLSTIRNADQIAVVQEGTIAELGSYKDLMAQPNGIFRKLVERQTITS
ncbi:ATP-binding cassette sub-family B member 10, mitochondrial-like isoform X1 [Penaeus japonicus]|uniref:ATP-binding cassette sub-family B member 10, mitochondrial-like isoform X1 n=1 Tax=Penaeus japonicus TaxID=27405 RepID=UPI001C714EBF|nr:ATP-binding cassette sub-family B member 10, mitochondrial-like isoform X1 [Penaeus japonicus]